MVRAYATRVNDANLLGCSSSGGAFTALASAVLSQGGCVFGCVWKRPEMIAVHAKAENEDELAAMRGSKYVKSDIAQALPQVVSELQAGRLVLFTGTPCQVAAVRKFVQAKCPEALPRLVCVEIICHGAPMPEVWEAYKRSLNKPLEDVSFKDKKTGWNDPALRLVFADGEVRESKLYFDPYVRAFENGLSQPPACFSCPFKDGKSGANITIGDCWGVDKILPEWADDRGVSCVIIHDAAGASLLERASQMMEGREVPMEAITQYNPNFLKPLTKHTKWQIFQTNVQDANFSSLATNLLDGPWVVRTARKIIKRVRRHL